MAREVDRLLAGLARLGAQAGHDVAPRSSAPAPATARTRSAARPAPPAERSVRREHVALWARVVLGIALGVMMTQWPYRHGCGLPLVEYLGAVAMVMVAGAWIAVASWKLRHPSSHILALLLILWGIALSAGEVLPRIGYAAQRWNWQC